jgi:hypothetical protein
MLLAHQRLIPARCSLLILLMGIRTPCVSRCMTLLCLVMFMATSQHQDSWNNTAICLSLNLKQRDARWNSQSARSTPTFCLHQSSSSLVHLRLRGHLTSYQVIGCPMHCFLFTAKPS